MLSLQKLFLAVLFLASTGSAFAQDTWPSPEVEQMYRHAGEYMALRNYHDAVITFKHAIALAPGHMILYRDLANAVYLSGSYEDAEITCASTISMPDADTECYRLLATIQAARGNTKSALATLKKGISRFPSSGVLYEAKGVISGNSGNAEDALLAWLSGIEHDAAYPGNYYHAAQVYLSSQSVAWGLLYGEIFLNITTDTTGVGDIKRLSFSGWKTFFDNIGSDMPKHGKTKQSTSADDFINAVNGVYTSLTPVVSDGITTENLIMVRTRFLMDWFSQYGSKYHFSLFSYMDELVRTGHFDIYNEWLFGQAESAGEFNSWATFHPGDLDRFAAWRKQHKLAPGTSEFYNDKNINDIVNEMK